MQSLSFGVIELQPDGEVISYSPSIALVSGFSVYRDTENDRLLASMEIIPNRTARQHIDVLRQTKERPGAERSVLKAKLATESVEIPNNTTVTTEIGDTEKMRIPFFEFADMAKFKQMENQGRPLREILQKTVKLNMIQTRPDSVPSRGLTMQFDIQSDHPSVSLIDKTRATFANFAVGPADMTHNHSVAVLGQLQEEVNISVREGFKTRVVTLPVGFTMMIPIYRGKIRFENSKPVSWKPSAPKYELVYEPFNAPVVPTGPVQPPRAPGGPGGPGAAAAAPAPAPGGPAPAPPPPPPIDLGSAPNPNPPVDLGPPAAAAAAPAAPAPDLGELMADAQIGQPIPGAAPAAPLPPAAAAALGNAEPQIAPIEEAAAPEDVVLNVVEETSVEGNIDDQFEQSIVNAISGFIDTELPSDEGSRAIVQAYEPLSEMLARVKAEYMNGRYVLKLPKRELPTKYSVTVPADGAYEMIHLEIRANEQLVSFDFVLIPSAPAAAAPPPEPAQEQAAPPPPEEQAAPPAPPGNRSRVLVANRVPFRMPPNPEVMEMLELD